MNKIIAPVDFSEISDNAARYAGQMAVALHKKLELVHIIQLPVVYGDVPMPVGEYDTLQREADTRLKQLSDTILRETGGKAEVKATARIGSPVYELVQESAHREAYCVVMGSHGAGAVERAFLGSTTQSLARESKCPVLVVPAGYHFKMPAKIGFASDFKDVVRATPERAIRMVVQDFGAKLEILHADPDYGEYEPAAMEEGLMLQTMFGSEEPAFRFLHSNYVEDSILQYAENNGLDMLMILPKSHSFIATLFQHKHTGHFLRQATMPIMVLHPE